MNGKSARRLQGRCWELGAMLGAAKDEWVCIQKVYPKSMPAFTAGRGTGLKGAHAVPLPAVSAGWGGLGKQALEANLEGGANKGAAFAAGG